MRVAFLREAFTAYARRHPEETARTARFCELLDAGGAAFERSHAAPGHFTASAWVLAPRGDAVALLHHAKLGIWVQPGGHADGDIDLHAVARREVFEETGLRALDYLGERLAPDGPAVPLDLDIHPIPARGDEPAHLHFDARYLLRAGTVEMNRSAESHALAWVPRRVLRRYTEEASVLRMDAKSRRLLADRAHRPAAL